MTKDEKIKLRRDELQASGTTHPDWIVVGQRPWFHDDDYLRGAQQVLVYVLGYQDTPAGIASVLGHVTRLRKEARDGEIPPPLIGYLQQRAVGESHVKVMAAWRRQVKAIKESHQLEAP